jgi:hypothetical protein
VRIAPSASGATATERNASQSASANGGLPTVLKVINQRAAAIAQRARQSAASSTTKAKVGQNSFVPPVSDKWIPIEPTSPKFIRRVINTNILNTLKSQRALPNFQKDQESLKTYAGDKYDDDEEVESLEVNQGQQRRFDNFPATSSPSRRLTVTSTTRRRPVVTPSIQRRPVVTPTPSRRTEVTPPFGQERTVPTLRAFSRKSPKPLIKHKQDIPVNNLLVRDPYNSNTKTDDGINKEEEEERIKRVVSYAPKKIPALVKPTEESATDNVSFKPPRGFLHAPLTDADFSFPSKPPVFYPVPQALLGESLFAQEALKRVKEQGLSISRSFGQAEEHKEDHDGQGNFERVKKKVFSSFGETRGNIVEEKSYVQEKEQVWPNYRPPIGSKSVEDFRNGDVSDRLDKKVDEIDTFTAPGPPYKPPTTIDSLSVSVAPPPRATVATVFSPRPPAGFSSASSSSGEFPSYPHNEVGEVKLRGMDFNKLEASAAPKDLAGGFPSPSASPPPGPPPSLKSLLPSSDLTVDISNLDKKNDHYPGDDNGGSTDFPKSLHVPFIAGHGFPAIIEHIGSYERNDEQDFRTPRLDHGLFHGTPDGVVDFGAASGGHGSFGWYSDHPVGASHSGPKW